MKFDEEELSLFMDLDLDLDLFSPITAYKVQDIIPLMRGHVKCKGLATSKVLGF